MRVALWSALVVAGCASVVAAGGCSSAASPLAPVQSALAAQEREAPPQDAAPKKAPDFQLKGDDGKTYTLAGLSKGKPLVLLFLKDGCSLVPTSMPFYNRIGKVYGKDPDANFVCVINDDEQTFPYWSKVHKPEFRFLLDPQKQTIAAYGVRASNEVFVIQDGVVLQHFETFSRKHLESMVSALAKGSKQTASVDVSDAPEKDRFG